MIRVVALSGGTGSSKFLRGLQKLAKFTVVANVADNGWFHGLYVCPDIDTVTYTLAGLADIAQGWGLAGDTFRALDRLKLLGSDDTWFKLGDLDLATHIFRTEMMRRGRSLTEVTMRIARSLGVVDWPIIPASDQHVETRILTAERGDLHLQEFWVRERGGLSVKGVRYKGVKRARATDEVATSIEAAERIIIPPANPITSIMPIVAIGDMRGMLDRSKARRVAISPMIGRGAVSGPAAKLMVAKNHKPTSEGVARLYEGLIDVLVIDEGDRAQSKEIEKRGISCVCVSTMMKSRSDEVELAKVAMEA
ncbi:MAG: 2-phospho-L-lactate transferase [Thaumarchaeota archaeon]|nr:2-phospho-L-lactate transferase [Nitrososphaerota archaeon]